MATGKIKVFVVMSNDYPHMVCYSQPEAEHYCDIANRYDEDWCKKNNGGRCYYHVKEVPLVSHVETMPFGCRDERGFWRERYFNGQRMETQ